MTADTDMTAPLSNASCDPASAAEGEVERALKYADNLALAHARMPNSSEVSLHVMNLAKALTAAREKANESERRVKALEAPIPMILFCPSCGEQHIDDPDERTPDWTNPPHRSHLCHGCGHIWRPADVATVGVREIATKGKADSAPASPKACADAAEARVKAMREASNALADALRGAEAAVQAAFAQADAEFRHHDKIASRHDATIRAWRDKRDAALASAQEAPAS